MEGVHDHQSSPLDESFSRCGKNFFHFFLTPFTDFFFALTFLFLFAFPFPLTFSLFFCNLFRQCCLLLGMFFSATKFIINTILLCMKLLLIRKLLFYTSLGLCMNTYCKFPYLCINNLQVMTLSRSFGDFLSCIALSLIEKCIFFLSIWISYSVISTNS